MTHEQVDQMLSRYRESKGRVGHLEMYIQMTRAEVEIWKRHLLHDAALATPDRVEGMPHGTDVGNPVENIVVAYVDGHMPDELRTLIRLLDASERELKELQTIIRFVDGWMSGLSDRESWIINHKVIDTDYSWREIMMMYRVKFGEEHSRDALKRIKDKAMDKIYRYAA